MTDAISRRTLLGGMLAGAALALAPRIARSADAPIDKLELPRSEWKKRLSTEAYHVLFEEGTERAGTSPLNGEKRKGTYVCAACMLPLFESSAKYESGTGWPSFFQSVEGRLR